MFITVSKGLATGPFPEQHASSPHLPPHLYFPEIHSNIILPSTPRSSELFLPFRFSNQNFVCISYFSVGSLHEYYVGHCPTGVWYSKCSGFDPNCRQLY